MKRISRYTNREGSLIGGIVHNCRGAGEDDALIMEFARKTNTRIVGNIPYSEEINKAELKSRTVIAEFPDSQISRIFKALARTIFENNDYRFPNLLSDEEMDQLYKNEARSSQKSI